MSEQVPEPTATAHAAAPDRTGDASEPDTAGAGEDSSSPPSVAAFPLNERWAVFALLTAAVGTAIAWAGGLDFPFFRDEIDYWKQTLDFVAVWPPSLHDLRSYGEPMTPLSFLIWGAGEMIFRGGVEGMRLVNTVFSAATLLLIGWRARTPERRGLLACVGLMLFPYWVPLSILIYTDMMSAFFVVLGMFFYARGRANASAIAFVFAIATRQYSVTFPAAILAAELWPVVTKQRSLRTEIVVPMALACASLLGWIAFFGGLGPDSGLETYPTHTEAIVDVTMTYGLYFLSCIGVYFVIPEYVFFGGWRARRKLSDRAIGLLAAAIFFAFAVFPPEDPITMGPLNRAGLFLFPPEIFGWASFTLRTLLYAFFAWIACLRFARIDLLFWLVLSRFALMTISWEGWEKYNTPLIAALWYVRSVSPLIPPVEIWRSDAPTLAEDAAGQEA